MRALALLLGRSLALLFALELADVPIICPEERAGEETRSAPPALTATSLGGTASVQVPDCPGNPEQSETDCSCPCHSVFQAAVQPDLADARVWIGLSSSSPARPLNLRDGAIDHPPQNLL